MCGYNLELLLQKVLWLVSGLVVNVDVGTLHVWKGLELDLQLLGHVVSRTERLVGFHDDVDFDEKTGAGGVGSDCVDGRNERGVGHGCENINIVCSRRDDEMIWDKKQE